MALVRSGGFSGGGGIATLLQSSPWSPLVLGGIACFWALRLVFQFFVYDSRLWRGDRFNTVMRILFTALWGYFTAVYAGVWLLPR